VGSQTFKFKQSSLCILGTSGLWSACGHPGPYKVLFRVAFQGCLAWVVRNRLFPAVEAA
jgi:hypothetical protein